MRHLKAQEEIKSILAYNVYKASKSDVRFTLKLSEETCNLLNMSEDELLRSVTETLEKLC